MAKPPIPSQLPPPPPPPPQEFSVAEISAAEQLVQLSGSSAESAAGEDASSFSTSTSPKSVNFVRGNPLDTVNEEEEESKRRNRRYRHLADLYAATPPIYCSTRKPGKKVQRPKKKVAKK